MNSRLSIMPVDTPDWMAPAWAGCMHYALGDERILAAFRRDTGNTWTPAATAIDHAIDEATGAPAEFIKAFVAWANVHVWGPIDGGATIERLDGEKS